MNELRQLLTQPDNVHLSAEMLALLADLEAADEEIEQLYPDETAHLSLCVACATEHAALVEMLFAAELGVIQEAPQTSLREELEVIWGRALRWKERVEQQWVTLIPQLLPPQQMAMLSESADAQEWKLHDTQLNTPLPLHVTIKAIRTSAAECQLLVRVDNVALPDPSGRTVQLLQGKLTQTAITDENGQVNFVAIPIATLPDSQIEIATH